MANTSGKKYGGRKKGTPNKVSSNLKEWLEKLIDKNRTQIERDIKSLKPRERVMLIEKFMQYTIPKMKSVETKIDLNNLSNNQLDNVIKEITKNVIP